MSYDKVTCEWNGSKTLGVSELATVVLDIDDGCGNIPTLPMEQLKSVAGLRETISASIAGPAVICT